MEDYIIVIIVGAVFWIWLLFREQERLHKKLRMLESSVQAERATRNLRLHHVIVKSERLRRANYNDDDNDNDESEKMTYKIYRQVIAASINGEKYRLRDSVSAEMEEEEDDDFQKEVHFIVEDMGDSGQDSTKRYWVSLKLVENPAVCVRLYTSKAKREPGQVSIIDEQ